MIPTMENRRLTSSSRRTSPELCSPSPDARSASGVMMWLDTMVDSAMEATMTIEVAEENPPRKASMVSASCPWAIGRVSTNMSVSASGGDSASPAAAIGSTNREISSR